MAKPCECLVSASGCEAMLIHQFVLLWKVWPTRQSAWWHGHCSTAQTVYAYKTWNLHILTQFLLTEIGHGVVKVDWGYCCLLSGKRVSFLHVCELERDIWTHGTTFQDCNKWVRQIVGCVDSVWWACVCLDRVLLGSVKDDHRSLLEDLRAASSTRTPLNKVLDAHKLTEHYRWGALCKDWLK